MSKNSKEDEESEAWLQALKYPPGSLVRSTGNEQRDKAVRVLAHSMVMATCAVDFALEAEQAMFNRYCAETGTPTLDYYDRVRRIYEALSPKSEHCFPILRFMILCGVITPSELVGASAEFLVPLIEKTKRELSSPAVGWLAKNLRDVQLPGRPPATRSRATQTETQTQTN